MTTPGDKIRDGIIIVLERISGEKWENVKTNKVITPSVAQTIEDSVENIEDSLAATSAERLLG